jgi:hypothetical protein
MNIRPIGVEFHADKWTDWLTGWLAGCHMTKLTVVFLTFAKAPRNWRTRDVRSVDELGNRGKSEKHLFFGGVWERTLFCCKVSSVRPLVLL